MTHVSKSGEPVGGPSNPELHRIWRWLEISRDLPSFGTSTCDSADTRDALIADLQAVRPDITVLSVPAGTVDVFGVVERELDQLPQPPTALFLTGLDDVAPDSAADRQQMWKSLNASRDLWKQRWQCPVLFWLSEAAVGEFYKHAVDFRRFISEKFEFPAERLNIFISYSHKDDIWRKKIEESLQPLVRSGKVEAWSDKAIVPGAKWHDEIDAALDAAHVALLLVSPSFLGSSFIMTEELPYLLRAAEQRGVAIVWVPVEHSLYEETPLKHIQAAWDTARPLKKLSGANRSEAMVQIAQTIRQLAFHKQSRPLPKSSPSSGWTTDSDTAEFDPHADTDGKSRFDDGPSRRMRSRDGFTDDFLSRVAEICRHRMPESEIVRRTDRETRLDYLKVVTHDGAFSDERLIAAFPHGVLPENLAAFVQIVQNYREDPGLVCELIYGGESVANELVQQTWLQHRIRLRSFIDYKGLIEFTPYVKNLVRRLDRDPRFPHALYVPQRLTYRVGRDSFPSDQAVETMLELLRVPDPRFILVLGDFGTGKSFLLSEVARELASDPRSLVPVLVEMRELEKGRMLDELIAQHLAHCGEERIDLKAFRYMLADGRIALLFDGFDELALRVTYQRAAEHFETLLSAMNGAAKVVVTSRTSHFENEQQIETALYRRATAVPGLRVVRLQPFDTEQTQQFLRRHYFRLRLEGLQEQGELGPREAAARTWADIQAVTRWELIRDVKNLEGLAANPRMLSFIVELDTEQLTQARDRGEGKITSAELYRLLIQRWLENECARLNPRPGSQPSLNPQSLLQAITVVALRLWQQLDRTLTLTDLTAEVASIIDKLTEQQHELAGHFTVDHAVHVVGSGALLIRDDEGGFSFVHQSLLEWLVANDAAEKLRRNEPLTILSLRALSPLMADFFWGCAGRDAARDWAMRVLERDSSHSETAMRNAYLVLDRMGERTRRGQSFAGQQLQGQDFSNRDLQQADFSGCDLTDAQFLGANLCRARFANATLLRADFTDANLSNAHLSGADFHLTRLLGADLRGTVLDEVHWRRAKLVGAKFDVALPRDDHTLGAALVGDVPLPCVQSVSSECHSVTWHPSGELLAAGHDDGSIRLWDLSSNQELRRLDGHRGAVSSLSFSSEGTQLASGGVDDSARLWDVSSGRELRRFDGHTRSVTSVSFSPDGAWLASGSGDGSVRLWDVASGQELRRFDGHSDWVRSVSFSPDGAWLASGSGDSLVRLWDVASGQVMRRFGGHTAVVFSVRFSPDGERLASGSADESIRLWDVANGQEIRRLNGHSGFVNSVNFSPDGKRLASGSGDQTIRLWDVTSGQELRRLDGHRGPVSSVSFSPDGARLASGSGDNSVRLWDVSSTQELRRLDGHCGSIGSVSFRPDGAQLASSSGDRLVRVWDVSSGQELLRLEGHTGQVFSVSFSIDGARLASGSADNSVRLWDVSTGQELRRLDGHSGAIWSVSFSPDGAWLASGSADRSIRLWDMSSRQELRRLDGHSGSINSVSFSPDSARLASGSSDNSVRLWDVSSGQELRRLDGHHDFVSSVNFSPDGAWLASGSGDKSVRLWDVSSGQELRRFDGHDGYVHSVSFSPNGARLASSSADHSVRLWAVLSGRELWRFEGHSDSVYSLRFSPDSARLATGSADGTIRLWDVDSGACLAILFATRDFWCAFTPDGSRYKFDGDLGGSFWYAIHLCRFEPGELDPYVPNFQRLPLDAPLFDSPSTLAPRIIHGL